MNPDVTEKVGSNQHLLIEGDPKTGVRLTVIRLTTSHGSTIWDGRTETLLTVKAAVSWPATVDQPHQGYASMYMSVLRKSDDRFVLDDTDPGVFPKREFDIVRDVVRSVIMAESLCDPRKVRGL